MAIGMDAFNSTNVISLDKSWQPHQPEPEIQDLSVTPSSGTTSHKSHPSLGSIGGTRISSPFQQNRSVSVTAGTVQTITLTRSDPDKVGDVSEDEDDIAVRDELEDDSEVASPAFLEHPSRSSSKEYKPLEQDLSSDSMEDAGFREDSTPSEPKSAPPEAISLAPTRKRRLPQTLLKPHRHVDKKILALLCHGGCALRVQLLDTRKLLHTRLLKLTRQLYNPVELVNLLGRLPKLMTVKFPTTFLLPRKSILNKQKACGLGAKIG